MLEQQVRRMLKDPKAEALAVNFAGQWLNLRGLQTLRRRCRCIYPDFDDPLRQAMRREVELLFDSIVREDRSIIDLLTADYTFVNERLAKHYGIPNIYGSQFRRVDAAARTWTSRKGLLGKGAFLATTSKPERTSPVTRGKWMMTNILGMSPPIPPPTCRRCRRGPPITEREGADDAAEDGGRTGCAPDCVQCHRLMDPIGFALENFDGIGAVAHRGRGHAGRLRRRRCSTARKVDGPVALRDWLVTSYSTRSSSRSPAEKLLTYALGRGVGIPGHAAGARDRPRRRRRTTTGSRRWCSASSRAGRSR